jgi:chemotaxis protein MotB
VSIADNGNIIIDESLLFEYDSHTVKRDGKKFLDTLAAAFAGVLSDPGVRANIDAVHIQGHTDERGSVSYNRELAARRANAVLDYMFEAHESLERDHGSFFASSAYSEFRPIDPGKSETAFRRNRRIEISVVLKDASVRALIDDYMRGIDPALQNHGPAQP